LVNLTDIYFKNAEAFDQGQKLIINEGGQGSSKTYSILQNIYDILKHSKRPLIASVCSYALPHLKIGIVRDLYNILLSYGENPDAIHNKTDHFFKIGKSTLEYFGIRDNYAKVHGPRRELLFINEANNRVNYDDFDQLNQRTHLCTFVDYNPRSEFWVHERVIPHFEHELIHSTYLDNPWLPEAELSKILWKKDKSEFTNWWRVYGEGKIGINEGQIFTNWTYGEFDNTLSYSYGLDFGFHPHPDAMLKSAIDEKRKKIYWDEKFYKSGQSTGELKKSVLQSIEKSNDLIVADCADPRMINELKTKSLTSKLKLNIVPVKKDGTVNEWIKTLLDYQFVITEDSFNLQKEFNNYLWSDKKAGIPIDDFNHLIDAGRYCFMYHKQKVNTNVWI